MKDFEDVVVVRAGYVRATNNRQQHWHRDRPLTHKFKGRALSVFVPCNVDIPADASCGRYVPLSHEGVPKPWFECPMDMEVGDMTVFSSELIHAGGAVPVGLPAGTPRIIAFIALANYNVHYNNTVPISPPTVGLCRIGGARLGELWAFRLPQECRTAPVRMLHVSEGPTVPQPCKRYLFSLRRHTYCPHARTL